MLHGFSGTSEGEALAPCIGLGEFILLVPAAVLDEMIHVRAVGAIGVAIDAQRRRLEIAAVLTLVPQRVLADEILLERLVRRGGEERRLREQFDLQRQQITEDSRQRHHHVDARPAEFGKRNQGPCPRARGRSIRETDCRRPCADESAGRPDGHRRARHKRSESETDRSHGGCAPWAARRACAPHRRRGPDEGSDRPARR